MACITPLLAWTSTAIIPISELPEPSVMVTLLSPSIVKVKVSPSIVAGDVNPLLKSPDTILAPAITWWFKTAVKASPLGTSAKLANAPLVGANTVKGAGSVPLGVLKTLTKSGWPSAVKAPTSELKLGSAVAKVTTVGKSITVFTAWMIPLVAIISAATTVLVPFRVTPSSMFT